MSIDTDEYKTTMVPHIDILARLRREAKARNEEFHFYSENTEQEKIFNEALKIHSKGNKDIKRFWRNLLIDEIY